ncbi:MAG TPA: pyridoxal phosphate-dependent aminotransferase [Thermoanaerobaculia bacterium]|nr:pyridoxal phosphate-dependent aminotransferase [Thermoanaerobaculia bacterium]
MKLASRMSRVAESATLQVSRRAKEMARQGVEVIDWSAGEPDFDSPAVAVEAARRALADGFTRYTPAVGIPRLREALAERYARAYGAPWGPGDVGVSVGAKAALFELALALYEPGDEVVLPSPCWVSFPEQIRLAGAEPVTVPTSPADSFRIHADALIERFTERTRAVLVNSPSNPTGGVIGAEDLRRLAAACAERDILLVCDETYERFVYDGGTHASVAALAGEFPDTVVLVGSFSKTYAMTGWRLGYFFAPPAVFRAVSDVQSHATSNPTSFAMAGAVAALEQGESAVAEMIAEYAARRELLVPRLDALPGVTCRPPSGAFYAFPDVSEHSADRVIGSVALAEYLLEEAHVAVVPGEAFGDDRHIRISFACSRDELERGLARIAEALVALTPRV